MRGSIKTIIGAIGGASMIAGIVLSLRAMWLGTVKEPRFRSDELMVGIPFWKMKSYLSPRAYRTHVAGTVLIILGCLIMILKGWMT